MIATAYDLKTCVRYLIHVGLVEIRYLGYGQGSHAQIADLADVLEFLPRFLGDDADPDFVVVREQFASYAQKYPQSWGQRYLDLLDNKNTVPDDY